MSNRLMVFVFGLTLGDYLLWNWSLNGGREPLALVSGLTLPPLALACLFLLAMSAARVIARTARRRGRGSAGSGAGERREREPVAATAVREPAAASRESSGKLAA